MTKVIIIPEENLDRFYERTVEHLQAKYHSRPSFLNTSNNHEQHTNPDTHCPKVSYSQVGIPMGKLVG